MILLPVQNKLVSAFSEYRLLHKQSSRQLPHNKLLYPPSLRYLPLWLLGKSQGALQCLKYKASYSCSSASHRLQHAACRLAACGQLCIVLCSDFLRVSKAASQLLTCSWAPFTRGFTTVLPAALRQSRFPVSLCTCLPLNTSLCCLLQGSSSRQPCEGARGTLPWMSGWQWVMRFWPCQRDGCCT